MMRMLIGLMTGLMSMIAKLGEKAVKNPEVALGIGKLMLTRVKK